MELEGLQIDCTAGLEFKIILKTFIEEMTCKNQNENEWGQVQSTKLGQE